MLLYETIKSFLQLNNNNFSINPKKLLINDKFLKNLNSGKYNATPGGAISCFRKIKRKFNKEIPFDALLKNLKYENS